MAKKPTKSAARTIDFSGVETFTVVSKGRHSFEIKNVVEQTGPEGVYWEVNAKCLDEDGRIRNNFSLTPKALWKLKGLLDACGMDTDGAVKLAPDELVGLTFDCDVTHHEHEGRSYADFGNFYAVSGIHPQAGQEEEAEEAVEEELEPQEEAAAEPPQYAFTEDDLKDISEEDLVTILDEFGIKIRLIGSPTIKRRMAIAALRKTGHIE